VCSTAVTLPCLLDMFMRLRGVATMRLPGCDNVIICTTVAWLDVY
jgi:hypothetical protein